MFAAKPDIIKLATWANSTGDNLRMLDLLENRLMPTIGLCMGPLSGESRRYGASHGSYLTFASMEKGKESAPGQIPIHELREFWRRENLE